MSAWREKSLGNFLSYLVSSIQCFQFRVRRENLPFNSGFLLKKAHAPTTNRFITVASEKRGIKCCMQKTSLLSVKFSVTVGTRIANSDGKFSVFFKGVQLLQQLCLTVKKENILSGRFIRWIFC